MMQISAAQFQEFQQQRTQTIEEGDNGDVIQAHQRQTRRNAAYWVAYCYWKGSGGVGPSREQAIRVLEQELQEQNNVVGDDHHDGTGKHRFLLGRLRLPVQRTRANEMFQQAFPRLEIEVQQGGNDDNFKEAMFSLSACLIWGRGVGMDRPQAIEKLKIAAELGHMDAQDLLTAYGVREPFFTLVFDWWKQMAVQHEHAWAQRSLGFCYHRGKGVEKDLVQAVEWYNKAIAQGDQMATESRDGLFYSLTPEERSKTLGGVTRNQKIEKAKNLIQQPANSVPLGLWALALESFQKHIHHPCEAPSPTFLVLCGGIVPQF